MRPIRPEPRARLEHGATLVELIVAIVIVGIVVAIAAYFVYPLRQGGDVAARAALTDTANGALQRIARDVRLALPNSIRVDATSVPGKVFLEFLAVRTAGRYRADTGGANGPDPCPDDVTALGVPGNDELSFNASDSCFKTIGLLPDAASVTTSDSLVLNNYGPGFPGQNAYATSGTLNRAQITGVDSTSESFRDRVAFAPTTFQRALHDSPGHRFYVVSGPVSYVCDTASGTVMRYWGYPISAAQPTSFAGGSAALLANGVSACSFAYTPNVSPQIGLLTLRVTLTRALVGGGSESVTLYRGVHVVNVP